MALKAVGINRSVKASGSKPSVPDILIAMAASEPTIKASGSDIIRGDISKEGGGNGEPDRRVLPGCLKLAIVVRRGIDD